MSIFLFLPSISINVPVPHLKKKESIFISKEQIFRNTNLRKYLDFIFLSFISFELIDKYFIKNFVSSFSF